MSGDGCTAITCEIEDLYECLEWFKPCSLIPICGNGIHEYNEECDDLNLDNLDGCTS